MAGPPTPTPSNDFPAGVPAHGPRAGGGAGRGDMAVEVTARIQLRRVGLSVSPRLSCSAALHGLHPTSPRVTKDAECLGKYSRSTRGQRDTRWLGGRAGFPGLSLERIRGFQHGE